MVERRLNAESLIALYPPDAPVRTNPNSERTISLSAALAAEAMCMADPARRVDPKKRLGELARMLHDAGSLRPEHQDYLPKKQR